MDYSSEARRFAEDYINSAVNAMGDSVVEAGDFYNRLYNSVMDKVGISREEVHFLHHPFHWVMFCNPESPFEYRFNPGRKRHEVLLKREPDSSELVGLTMKNYSSLIEERIRKRFNGRGIYR